MYRTWDRPAGGKVSEEHNTNSVTYGTQDKYIQACYIYKKKNKKIVTYTGTCQRFLLPTFLLTIGDSSFQVYT